jgi:polyadenylate-binding protein
LSGTLNLPMRYEELSALSPVVRKEVLSGELNRRIKDLEGVSVQEDELDGIIDSIVNLNLAEVVEVLGDQNRLVEQIKSQQQPAGNGNGSSSLHQTPDKSTSPSPAPSQDSRLLDPQALIATASAPEHPSTPVSFSGSLSDPPRTASPSTSIPVHSDRQRLLAEVVKLEPKMAEEITGLLMSLSKRERALCLFSADILKQKVAAAREIVALETEDDEPAAPPIPVTPIKKTRAVSADASPRNPDLSSRATSAVASPAPITPGQTKVESGHTVASLAQLPAEESVKVLASPAVLVALSIPAPDSLVTRSTDEFIDSLASQSKSQQKQALGEKLFKFVKAAGGAKNAVSAPSREAAEMAKANSLLGQNYDCVARLGRSSFVGTPHEQLPDRTQGKDRCCKQNTSCKVDWHIAATSVSVA